MAINTPRRPSRFRRAIKWVLALALLGGLAVVGVGALIGSDSLRAATRSVLGDRVSNGLRDQADSVIDRLPALPDSARDAARSVSNQVPSPNCPEYWIKMQWGNAEGGRSLLTSPTQCTRDAGVAALDDAWVELIALTPEANVPGMRDQLACHMIGAPSKETWNLEPWRPAVGLRETLATACNPT